MSRGHQEIGGLKKLATSPTTLRHGMNAWPPFLFSGIRIQHIAPDFRTVRVGLRRTPVTSNYVGTLFGGSIFSMTDPFWMMMILRNLGPAYVVWDKAAEIEFVSPGKASVSTTFELTQEVLDELREEARGGAKVLRWFENDVTTADGTLVAKVRKQIYVREKPPRT
ncbi:DUF4442 domain-containing protein [Ornithinimicrobium panacihumi]|uniref:DUF4442 domain-containing protein n=1 Tax=Ornithinimicrobium panacihumi TaxID=2008449 RepID=UPI003F899F5B